MGTPVQSTVTDSLPDSGTTRSTSRDPEAGADTRALTIRSTDTEASQDELQALVDCLRSKGVGITITGEGKIVTFPMASDAVVDKLKIIEGVDAWHYHNNPLYSDCVLEVEGLPRMHASAEYLSLHSRFFTALFTSPLRESTSRVIRLTPPDPSTFVWALHHLYTGALSAEHEKLLVRALDKGDGDTFWGLYQNASFLDCPTLMDECMEVLRVWVAKAEDWGHLGYYQPQLHASTSGGDPRHAVFRHPAFQPSLVWPASLVKLLHFLHSVPLRLFIVLSWLDNEEREGQQAKGLQVASKELARSMEKCASEAVKAGARLLKPALEAFPSVFYRVITPALLIPRLERLEEAEKDARLSLEKLQRDSELLTCTRCETQVPRSLMDKEGACVTHYHYGDYSLYQVGHGGGWSCCHAIRKAQVGCVVVRGTHVIE